jgi:cytochrome c
MDGIYFANSAAPTLVGVSLRDTKDAAGKPFGKNIMQVIESQGEGSVDYMWLNYTTNKVEKKRSFVKRVEDFVLGVGYYTR